MPTFPRRLTRTRVGKNFSEGARLMWLAIAGEPLLRAAERVGCSAGMLTHWLYGDRRPTAEWLTKIEDRYGVPAASWGREPTETFTLPASADDSGEHPATSVDPTGTDASS